MPKNLTTLAINAALRESKKTGKTTWLTDGSIPRGHGGLQLRVDKGMGRWYWRYSVGTKKVRMALGTYAAEKTPACLTLVEARQVILDKAALYQDPETRDVREHLKREYEAREAAIAAKAEQDRRQAEQARLASKHTLLALLEAYRDELETAGKQSGRDVRYLIKSHVENAHPQLAALPAKDVTPDQITEILRTLVSAGKGRTAAKLRSYMRAAYSRAVTARLDSSASQALVAFGVTNNPVAATSGLSQFNKALDRTLSLHELRAYWQHLEALPKGAMRDGLMLSLILGGQRPAQVVRLETADVDLAGRTLTLYDAKGRRSQPRTHTLPLCDLALQVIQSCLARAEKQETTKLISSRKKVAVWPEQLAKIASGISESMIAEGVSSEKFQLRDIRRTVETLLAAEGVSSDVLARLLSHGLGGVQSRHYNRHAYLGEMRHTLAKWEQLLTGSCEPSNVIPFNTEAA